MTVGLTHYTNRTSCGLTDNGCFKPVGAQCLAPLQWTVTPSFVKKSFVQALLILTPYLMISVNA
jgi:hypothetical protein